MATRTAPVPSASITTWHSTGDFLSSDRLAAASTPPPPYSTAAFSWAQSAALGDPVDRQPGEEDDGREVGVLEADDDRGEVAEDRSVVGELAQVDPEQQ